jgi:hypothetical protein
MKRAHIIYCLPLISLMLICMDDDTEEDIYNAPEECTDYFFPPLLATHIYPIHIYEWFSYQKRLRPLFGDKKDFAEYRRNEKRIEEKYNTLLEGVRDRVTKDDLISVKNIELARLQKKHADKTHFGRFIIYTAFNKEERFKNPWYCIGTLKLQERVAGEMKCAERAKLTFYTKPDSFNYTYTYPPISLKDKTVCDETLAKFVQVISTHDATIHISYPTYKYAKLMKVIKNSVAQQIKTTHDTAARGTVSTTDLSVTAYSYKWELKKGTCPMKPYKSNDADLSELYEMWPEHETKERLGELRDEKTIPFTSFSYIDASPSSSPEDSPRIFREVELLTVNPSYSPASSSRSSSRFSSSTTYKLQ